MVETRLLVRIFSCDSLGRLSKRTLVRSWRLTTRGRAPVLRGRERVSKWTSLKHQQVNLQSLHVIEDVQRTNVKALVVVALHGAELGGDALDRLLKSKLIQRSQRHGKQDQVGACIDDNVRARLKENEVKPGVSEGVSSHETDWAAPDDNSLGVGDGLRHCDIGEAGKIDCICLSE